jgi:hypothetical protein
VRRWAVAIVIGILVGGVPAAAVAPVVGSFGFAGVAPVAGRASVIDQLVPGGVAGMDVDVEPQADPMAEMSTQDMPGPAVPRRFTGDIPTTVLDAYRRARDTLARTRPGCRLPLELLAAIGKVESNHARRGWVDRAGTTVMPILGPVLDGNGYAAIRDTDLGTLDGDTTWDRAVGPMQFIPGTWKRWASDGNDDKRTSPHNIYDASPRRRPLPVRRQPRPGHPGGPRRGHPQLQPVHRVPRPGAALDGHLRHEHDGRAERDPRPADGHGTATTTRPGQAVAGAAPHHEHAASAASAEHDDHPAAHADHDNPGADDGRADDLSGQPRVDVNLRARARSRWATSGEDLGRGVQADGRGDEGPGIDHGAGVALDGSGQAR